LAAGGLRAAGGRDAGARHAGGHLRPARLRGRVESRGAPRAAWRRSRSDGGAAARGARGRAARRAGRRRAGRGRRAELGRGGAPNPGGPGRGGGGDAVISVVIPNWNGREWLAGCLAALAAQERAAEEVIVVDNGSRDESLTYLRDEHPEVRVIALSDNTG